MMRPVKDNMLDDTCQPRVNQNHVDMIYETIYITCTLLEERQVTYCAMAGTLLGAVRHGGLIPWDDDADIGYTGEDVDKIRTMEFELGEKGCGLYEGNGWGFRVFLQAGDTIPDVTEYRFPFLDLLQIEWNGTTFGYSEAADPSERRKHRFQKGLWEGICRYSFGPLNIAGPSMDLADEYLEHAYGANWRHESYVTFDNVKHMPIPRRAVKLVTRGCAWPSWASSSDPQ